MVTNKEHYTKMGELSIRQTENKKHPEKPITYELLFQRVKRKFTKHTFYYINKETGQKVTQKGKPVKLPPKVIFTCQGRSINEVKPLIEEFLDKTYNG